MLVTNETLVSRPHLIFRFRCDKNPIHIDTRLNYYSQIRYVKGELSKLCGKFLDKVNFQVLKQQKLYETHEYSL